MADKYIKNIKIPNNTTDSFHPKLANQLTAGTKKFDGSVAISITASDLGALTGTINTTGLGGGRVGKKYSAAANFTVGTGTTAPSINTLSTTAGKYYAIEADSSGLLFVNVPWTDNNTNYYISEFTWTAGTTAGPTASITRSGTSALAVGAIPTATASASGIVTTGAQTFGGTKTLTAVLNSASTATTQATTDSSTKVATTAFVKNCLSNITIDDGSID